MWKDMSKRIIFSVWSDLVDDHPSASDKKTKLFNLYKDRLIEKQKEYAYICNSDYELFTPDKNNYVDVQFYKILQTEKLLEHYDEVLYLDLDVIPKTQKIIFDSFNLDNVSVYQLLIGVSRWVKPNLRFNNFSGMGRYAKLSCKKAMLLLDDITGNDNIANTGVFCMNKTAAESLKFSERLPEAEKRFTDAIEDNLYPEEMSSCWKRNNEVFLTYMLEKYKIPNNNIGQPWNYILDDYIKYSTDACYFQHQVNKDFKI